MARRPARNRHCRGSWHDIEHRELLHTLRMIERQAIGDTAAPVMASDCKFLKAQLDHDLHEFCGHFPFRVGCVIGSRGWASALPIPPEISTDKGEVTGEQRRNVAPHQMCLWKSVEQQNGWPVAQPTIEDRRFPGAHICDLRTVEHRASFTVRGNDLPAAGVPTGLTWLWRDQAGSVSKPASAASLKPPRLRTLL
jgi:hypothetical protein